MCGYWNECKEHNYQKIRSVFIDGYITMLYNTIM